ncbi:MAG: phosphoadenylyl-sulfate reductase [Bacteroidales bacterium]|nr:phosphoadenylyl-sulfate reductase [Bacteroidales bacterium]
MDDLTNTIQDKTVKEQLEILAARFPGKVVFTTSFGMEDQVITHLIFENDIPVEVVTLDTGRLFPETYKVFGETISRYQKKISIYFPQHKEVEKMVTEKGPFSFYHSKENRLECCHIRKVIPLNRALQDKSCWISGIRSDQSDSRSQMKTLEFDDARKLYKFYPLFNWSFAQVEDFIRENNIPYNTLHDKGFKSIGCQPCSRAVQAGADFRSGRWWWETDGKKECGLHLK